MAKRPSQTRGFFKTLSNKQTRTRKGKRTKTLFKNQNLSNKNEKI